MPSRASYRKLDFVDYFDAFTQIQDKWIEQFISNPKCLVALEVFATNRVVFGRAVHFLTTELPKLDSVMGNILLQSTRRYFLSREDARHIEVGKNVKAQYPELRADASIKEPQKGFWSSWSPHVIRVRRGGATFLGTLTQHPLSDLIGDRTGERGNSAPWGRK
jgi:hypothetical protein